jgi:Flp pilus assembly protein TadD
MSASRVERASALARLGRWEEAAAVYSRLLLGRPDDVGALCGLSRCLGRLGRAGEGLCLAERAAALAPADDWPHRLRSAHLLALGRSHEALPAAGEAVRREHAGLASLLTLFEAQFRLHQADAATATAELLVDLHPDEPEAHGCAGRAAMLRRSWQDAESAFRTALAMRPRTAVYLSNVALALERQGRRREAMAMYQDAVRTDPGDATARELFVRALDRNWWLRWRAGLTACVRRQAGAASAGRGTARSRGLS